jgi:hypothetical protein
VTSTAAASRAALRRLLSDPRRARVALLASEVLGPPVALRDPATAGWSQATEPPR